MSIEDYMKNPCCGGNGGGGSDSDDTTKPINEILVKSFESEDGTIYYQAFAKYVVTTNLKITVSSTNGIVTELDLYVGDMESKAEIGETLQINGISLNASEDDVYKYVAVSESTKTSYDIYTKAVLLSKNGEFSEDFNKQTLDMNTSSDIKFIIPSTDINYNEIEDIEEFEQFCANNQYCLALCIPKEIYDNKYYSITNYGGSDITNKFTYTKSFTIDGVDYVFLDEHATDDIYPFVPLYDEELIYEYKLTLNK
jgi:hypothetical protein